MQVRRARVSGRAAGILHANPVSRHSRLDVGVVGVCDVVGRQRDGDEEGERGVRAGNQVKELDAHDVRRLDETAIDVKSDSRNSMIN